MLLVVCAWCKEVQGAKDGQGVTGVSHGLCPRCEAELRAEAERMNVPHVPIAVEGVEGPPK